MKLKSALLTVFYAVLSTSTLFAAVPAAEKLLPSDTLLFVTVPDYAAAQKATTNLWQFYNDPALRPFRDKAMGKISKEIIAPMERELGIKFADHMDLAQGQMTFAVVQDDWQGAKDKLPGIVVMLDAKEKSEKLKKTLTDLRKRWTDSGRQVRVDKIRDIEFATLLVNPNEVSAFFEKVFPKPVEEEDEDEDEDGEDDAAKKKEAEKKAADAKKNAPKVEFSIGQSGSLLIASNSRRVIEKLVARQSGGSVPTVSEQPGYEAAHSAQFRDAHAFAWVYTKPVFEILFKTLAAESKSASPDEPTPDKVLTGLGLTSIKSLAYSYRQNTEGGMVQFVAGMPESARLGLFKAFALQKKESAPPAFVPIDAIDFKRWRFDFQKLWTGVETTVASISPQWASGMKMMFDLAGKDKDEKFDVKRELIGNIGDDWISYEKKPRSESLEALASPPALSLIGSPNADKLINALKTVTSSLGPQMANLKEREFLGKKIYSLKLGYSADEESAPALSLAASSGYLAISSDPATLEEYLRQGDSKPKSLSEIPGFSENVQKVGGTGLGLFGFQNQKEQTRTLFQAWKKNPEEFAATFAFLGARFGLDDEEKFKEWFDVSLLPSFDAVSKYFHYAVYSGSFTPEGFVVKYFAPTPPELLKK